MLINGEAYAWRDISFTPGVTGEPVRGIVAISYGDKVKKANNYGAGSMPISRAQGEYEAEASVTVEMVEVERLQKNAPGGRIQNYRPFTITVVYLNLEQEVVTHRILNVEFTGNKRDVKKGDTSIEVELELITSEILWT